MLARDQPVFVFGMDRDAARARFQRGQNVFWLVQQQRAGGGAQERLDAADAGQLFQFGQGADIGGRGAGIKGVVAMHAALGAGQLVLDGGAGGGGRRGVGHFEHAGDAAQDGGRLPVSRSSLCSLPGSRKCTWLSIAPGQDMQALGLENFGGLGMRKGADGGDAAADDPDIGRGNAVGGGDRAAPDQKIESCSLMDRQLAHPPAPWQP